MGLAIEKVIYGAVLKVVSHENLHIKLLGGQHNWSGKYSTARNTEVSQKLEMSGASLFGFISHSALAIHVGWYFTGTSASLCSAGPWSHSHLIWLLCTLASPPSFTLTTNHSLHFDSQLTAMLGFFSYKVCLIPATRIRILGIYPYIGTTQKIYGLLLWCVSWLFFV